MLKSDVTVRNVKALLDLGSPVNCVNLDGLTPLYLCVSRPTDTDPEIVEMLLRDYAQHGVRDVPGSTELHQVCGLRSLIKFRTVKVSLTTFRSGAKQFVTVDRLLSCLPCPFSIVSTLQNYVVTLITHYAGCIQRPAVSVMFGLASVGPSVCLSVPFLTLIERAAHTQRDFYLLLGHTCVNIF